MAIDFGTQTASYTEPTVLLANTPMETASGTLTTSYTELMALLLNTPMEIVFGGSTETGTHLPSGAKLPNKRHSKSLYYG
jgi:hypothetical protein